MPERKPNRLVNFDYSTEGAYFITICTHQRRKMLSHIRVGAIRESPLQKRSIISKVIGYLKMNVSKEVHRNSPNLLIWQRSFHDHVIRDGKDYNEIADYIETNPMN